MKRVIMIAAIAVVALSSCEGQFSDKLQEQIQAKQEEAGQQASQQMKDAFVSQLGEFMQSKDLGESLGISAEEQDKMEQSLKDYVNHYDLSEEDLSKVKESVEELFQNAQGMTVQGLENKLSDILKQ